jgi:hypothetical protein
MPLCPNGQKAIITWQYPGEDKQQILGADDYTVKSEEGKCPVPYKFKFRYKLSSGANWRYGETNATNLYPPFENMFIRSDDQTFGEDPKGFPTLTVRFANYYTYGGVGRYLVYFELIHSLANGTRVTSRPISFEATTRDLEHTTEFLGMERRDGLPDNCGECVFRITKNGQAVYQKSNLACPVVTHTCGEQCPPGSCECDCGTEVCCYDTVTGKAVKSFRK